MKKRKVVISLFISMMMFSSCGKDEKITSYDHYYAGNPYVLLLKGDNFTADFYSNETKDGEVSFPIHLEKGYTLSNVSYDDYSITGEDAWNKTLTLHHVQYDDTITLETRKLEVYDLSVTSNDSHGDISYSTSFSDELDHQIYEGDTITVSTTVDIGYSFNGWTLNGDLTSGEFYSNDLSVAYKPTASFILCANLSSIYENAVYYDFNGGQDSSGNPTSLVNVTSLLARHPRVNTLTGLNITKEGHSLIGWNTKADGSGDYVSLGGRITYTEDKVPVLYAVWAENEEESKFTLDGSTITAYSGNEEDILAIPKVIQGVTVTGIASNAFTGVRAKSIAVPNSITAISKYAFSNCVFDTLYLNDNLMDVDDYSFYCCSNFKTLHMNAVVNPLYIINGYGGKMDIYDKIAVAKDEDKIILAGGSSVMNGYRGDIIDAGFNGKYKVFNLGLTAVVSGLPQLEMILPYMKQGDVLLSAPEPLFNPNNTFYGQPEYSPIVNGTAYTMQVSEALFYVFESNWDMVSHLTMNLYSDFFSYYKKFATEKASYNSPYTYENGPASPSYDEYGDTYDHIPCQGTDQAFYRDAINFDCVTEDCLRNADSLYQKFIEKGTYVAVTFAPINRVFLEWARYQSEFIASHYDSAVIARHCNDYTQKVRNNLSSNVRVILNQYDTVYAGRYFSDSDFHLGYDQAVVHTQKVMAALQAQMKEDGYDW